MKHTADEKGVKGEEREVGKEKKREGKKLEGPAVIDVEKRELTKQYSGWEPELIALLDVSSHKPLPHFFSKRDCLTSSALNHHQNGL